MTLMKKLTPKEKDRIEEIRLNLRKMKRAGHDTSSWEAHFFLKIVDRLLRE